MVKRARSSVRGPGMAAAKHAEGAEGGRQRSIGQGDSAMLPAESGQGKHGDAVRGVNECAAPACQQPRCDELERRLDQLPDTQDTGEQASEKGRWGVSCGAGDPLGPPQQGRAEAGSQQRQHPDWRIHGFLLKMAGLCVGGSRAERTSNTTWSGQGRVSACANQPPPPDHRPGHPTGWLLTKLPAAPASTLRARHAFGGGQAARQDRHPTHGPAAPIEVSLRGFLVTHQMRQAGLRVGQHDETEPISWAAADSLVAAKHASRECGHRRPSRSRDMEWPGRRLQGMGHRRSGHDPDKGCARALQGCPAAKHRTTLTCKTSFRNSPYCY
jgi:hypothetical protein